MHGFSAEAFGRLGLLRPAFAKAKAALRYCLRQLVRGQEPNDEVLICIGLAASIRETNRMLPSYVRTKFLQRNLKSVRALLVSRPDLVPMFEPYQRFLARLLRKEIAAATTR